MFLANAPKKTTIEMLLNVAFSRWRVERCFEDDKKFILSAVSLLFLAGEREQLLGDYPELTVCQVRQATSTMVQSWWLPRAAVNELISNTACKLTYYQKRIRQARESHTKTRKRKLEELGVDLAKIKRCQWDSG